MKSSTDLHWNERAARIENDIEVWARDPHHFPKMQQVLSRLKLFQEPP